MSDEPKLSMEEYVTMLCRDAVEVFREGETRLHMGLMLTRIAYNHGHEKYDRFQAIGILRDYFGSVGQKIDLALLQEWVQWQETKYYGAGNAVVLADEEPRKSSPRLSMQEYTVMLAKDALSVFRDGEDTLELHVVLAQLEKQYGQPKYDSEQASRVLRDQLGFTGHKVQRQPLEEWAQWAVPKEKP